MSQIKSKHPEFKTWDELTFTDDFLFCMSMQNEKICRTLLEILLETEISEINYIRSQEAISLSPGRHGVRLDIRVKSDGRIINVELQNYYESDLPFRIRYYQAMGDSQLLRQGTSYDVLPEYVTLFICTSDPFNGELPAYHIEHKIRENPAIIYDDKRRIVVYNSSEWRKAKNPEIRAMLQYIDGHRPENSDRVSEFADDVQRFKDDNTTAEEYMDWYMFEHDMKRWGREEAQEEIARNLLKMGLSLEQIAQGTNLPLEQVEALRSEVTA